MIDSTIVRAHQHSAGAHYLSECSHQIPLTESIAEPLVDAQRQRLPDRVLDRDRLSPDSSPFRPLRLKWIRSGPSRITTLLTLSSLFAKFVPHNAPRLKIPSILADHVVPKGPIAAVEATCE
jgi:hypothetical protein